MPCRIFWRKIYPIHANLLPIEFRKSEIICFILVCHRYIFQKRIVRNIYFSSSYWLVGSSTRAVPFSFLYLELSSSCLHHQKPSAHSSRGQSAITIFGARREISFLTCHLVAASGSVWCADSESTRWRMHRIWSFYLILWFVISSPIFGRHPKNVDMTFTNTCVSCSWVKLGLSSVLCGFLSPHLSVGVCEKCNPIAERDLPSESSSSLSSRFQIFSFSPPQWPPCRAYITCPLSPIFETNSANRFKNETSDATSDEEGKKWRDEGKKTDCRWKYGRHILSFFGSSQESARFYSAEVRNNFFCGKYQVISMCPEDVWIRMTDAARFAWRNHVSTYFWWPEDGGYFWP